MLGVAKIFCAIAAIIGSTFLLPIAAAAYCREFDVIPAFAIPMAASWLLAAVLVVAGRNWKLRLSVRSSFAVVAGAWLCICIFGTIPIYASGAIPRLTDAFFESVSGFSTTGASIMQDIDGLPRSIRLWRCQMHWLGGMGVVALTVALFPILGVGGFQLLKAETTGVEKGKITPKIATTAKTLWLLYVGFTLAQTLLLRLFGMDFIDAMAYAFSTLGTGGFSMTNAGLEAFEHRLGIEIVCTAFMILGGINFSLYFYALTGKFYEVRKNSELRAYLAILVVSTAAIALLLLQKYGSIALALRHASFHAASIMTTTGFATCDYTDWPSSAQSVLFALSFIGGCSGSTAGGFKVVRWVILLKQSCNETLKMLHPRGVFTVRLNDRPGRRDVVLAVAAFFFVYKIIVSITTFIGTLAGLNVYTALTAAYAMIQNIGPAFDGLGPAANYGFLPDWVKWWYCFVMLAGRLELYTMVIFFSRGFWKK